MAPLRPCAACRCRPRQGKITCVLGRNGVGKTSLMRAIVGQHRLTGGRVTFEGKALDRSAAYDRARSGIAFVPQGREIFPLLTVKENLETGFAPLKRGGAQHSATRLRAVPGAERHAERGAAATFPAASSSSLRSAARW